MASFDVRIGSALFWRDWMPIVQNPGPDGGSPLLARIEVELHSHTASPVQLKWRVELTTARESSAFPFEAQDARGGAWDGALAPHALAAVELYSRQGPYLPLGTELSARVMFTSSTGESVSAQTARLAVRRTD